MNYNEFALKLFAQDEGLKRIKEYLADIKGKNILVFSHDDPDGITSACIMLKIIDMNGGRPTILFPDTYELEESRLKEALALGKYDAVFLLDKGTMGYYDNYADIIQNFFVIDHHFPQGEFKKIAVFNPALRKYEFCSCSFLMNILAQISGCRDEFVDLLTYIGLKGDWAIEPATDFVSDFVKTYFDETKDRFSGLLAKIEDKPTMFEVVQREKTTLLNRITEFIHAISGGGFQYFYNDRDEKLKDVSQVDFTFKLLMKLNKKTGELLSVKSFKDFMNLLPQKPVAAKLFGFFLEDWDQSVKMLDTCVKIGQFNDTAMYFFAGTDVPLLPMVGSVKISALAASSGQKYALFVMVNSERSGGTHFSVRGTGVEVHVGKICGNLASRLQKLHNDSVNITGGGHPKAGECKTRKAKAPISQNILEFFRMFDEMYVLNAKTVLTEEEKTKAVALGLEYKK